LKIFPLLLRERRDFKATKGFSDKRRAGLDIIADILDTSRGRAKKTHLMCNYSMSFTQLKGYLDLILKAKLLMIENDGANLLFKTSSKGRSFLKSYQSLKALME